MLKILNRVTLMIIVLCVCVTSAYAETARGDLDSRFDWMVRVEYEGVEYSLRSRLTTVLAMAVSSNENGVRRADFARILVVDDAQKTFSMIDIPENTLVQVPADTPEGFSYMRFADVYATGEDAHASCLRLVEQANALLGQELVENYIAFDLEGLTVLNGGVEVEGTTRQKLSVLKGMVDSMSTDEINDTYAKLGDYIITDMKSGAVMKIVDKADRYERTPTRPMPGTKSPAGAVEVLVPDEAELEKLMIELFFEENAW